MIINITLVVPVKYSCPSLRDTLHSIIAQSCHPYQTIVVHFGDIEHKVLKMLYDIPNVCFVRDEGKGVYNSMNTSLGYIKGDYVLFLGSGDTLCTKHSLEQAAKSIESYYATHAYLPDLAIFDVRMPSGNIFPGIDVTADMIMRGFMPCHQGVLASTHLFERLHGFDISYKIAADFDFLLRAVILGSTLLSERILLSTYLGGGISHNGSLPDVFRSLFMANHYFSAFRYIALEVLARVYRKLSLHR